MAYQQRGVFLVAMLGLLGIVFLWEGALTLHEIAKSEITGPLDLLPALIKLVPGVAFVGIAYARLRFNKTQK
jgi:hypothetical protein